MADNTPQLKRKREGLEVHQKKSKKQKKVDPPSSTSTSTPNSKTDTKLTSQISQEATVSKSTPTDAPPTAGKDKKKKHKAHEKKSPESHDAGQDVETPVKTEDVVDRSKSKNPKAKNKHKANPDGNVQDGQDLVPGDGTNNTSAQNMIQRAKLDQAMQGKDKKKEDQVQEKDSNQLINGADLVPSKPQASSSKRKKNKKSKTQNLGKWSISPPQGAWFLPIDPLFSLNEKFLLLATFRSLQVYATDTSTLVNTLPVEHNSKILTYALSSTKPNMVYIADSRKCISLWNWCDGTKIQEWNIKANVLTMTVVARPESDEDLVYCCHESGNNSILNVHTLTAKSTDTEAKSVVDTPLPIHGIQVLMQGKYVILNCRDSIVIAKQSKFSNTTAEDFEYVWREMKFSKRITACSARLRHLAETSNGKKKSHGARDVLDIVVGDVAGVILLFEDILPAFAAIESSQKGNRTQNSDAESFRPKKLHWHREAVGAVKWSLDGNYLISGGEETVLSLWQLATGKQQYLPHLTAAIERITVSPSGCAYGITLANNSIIVLSTTELEAKTNIVGIQSRRVDFQKFLKQPRSGKGYWNVFNQIPMAIDPQNPNEVLLSTPSSQSRSSNKALQPEPYLQTFDFVACLAKSQQALTRNYVTDINLSPEGGRVIEPSIKLLRVSHDGQWLATVDEWIPSNTDSTYLDEGVPEFNEENRLQRREVYLKFWRHDVEHRQWKLDTRIDAPHFFENKCSNGIVFDIVADPAIPGFATVGDDHVVRIWRPKTRLRNGTIVRGAQEQGLVTWQLKQAIEISDKFDVVENSNPALAPHVSRLAFSGDGSVLAIAISWATESDHGIIHLIDPKTGTIRRSITEINVTALAGLGVLGRHLIAVSDSITIWDMVLDQLVHSMPIRSSGIDQFERIPLIRLAINGADNTFAVALPRFEKNDIPDSKPPRASSKILVFDVEKKHAIWSSHIPTMALALLPRHRQPGYISLDSRSCLQTMGPTVSAIQLPTPPPEAKELQREAITANELEEEQSSEAHPKPLLLEDLSQDLDDEKPVLNQQSLQEVFDDGAVSLAPQGLFNAVLALVGRTPKATV